MVQPPKTSVLCRVYPTPVNKILMKNKKKMYNKILRVLYLNELFEIQQKYIFFVPGGPDRRAALAQNPLSAPEPQGGGFEFFTFPALLLLLLLSQFLIQLVNFLMLLLSPCCPMMAFDDAGLYFSTHNCEFSPSC